VKTPTATTNSVPHPFLDRYGEHVIGILHGFDRLRFRGTLRQLYCPRVMEARQLDQGGIAYQKKENTFLRVADLARAQRLLDEQLETDWRKELAVILKTVHPLNRQICRPLGLEYYWSAAESEFATDIIFKDPESLARFYPSWVHHAMSSFSSHSVNGNSIKFYDKQGSVLRVETTIVRPEQFKTYRKPESRPKDSKRWLPLRRGLADFKRRAETSKRANDRYLKALAATSGVVPLFEWVQKTCQPVCRQGRHYRGLNPWSKEDGALLQLINRGEFMLNGFRNRDLCHALFKPTKDATQLKRRMGWMCRRLRLLRAHGLVQKVSGTHRYVVSDKGRTTITALLAARKADVDQLTKMAA
jgi:hypothetical protein